jgi:hypothetical protein
MEIDCSPRRLIDPMPGRRRLADHLCQVISDAEMEQACDIVVDGVLRERPVTRWS